MASITAEPNGRRTIQFVGKDAKRRSIRLGKCPQKTAEAVKVRIEQLNAAVIASHAVDPDTSRWLAGIDKLLADKLAKVGLIAKREMATLGPFIDTFLATRTDLKERTKTAFRQVRKNLVEYFGESKRLADINAGDADNFRLTLMESLGENTVRRRCGRAKQLFRAAIRHKLIQENPFADMRDCQVKPNRDRDYFITREVAQRVLDACPDTEWRLIFALSRYGGLRCPSEHLALTWADVDWEHSRLTIRSPKTEHHIGKESRLIPLFPELRPYLEEAFELAQPRTEYVIIRYRDSNANLRTQLSRILRRAGVKRWPKVFHNLRASRATELAGEYPGHVAAAWLGHSREIAASHYWQVTDADFARASASGQQSTDPKGGAKSGAAAVRNPVQQPSAVASTNPQSRVNIGVNRNASEHLRSSSTPYELRNKFSIAGAGLEPARPITGHRILSFRMALRSTMLHDNNVETTRDS
jgi:integrase